MLPSISPKWSYSAAGTASERSRQALGEMLPPRLLFSALICVACSRRNFWQTFTALHAILRPSHKSASLHRRYFIQTTLGDFYHQNYITPLLAVIINNTAATPAAPLSLAAKDYVQSECLREGIIELFAVHQEWGMRMCVPGTNFLHSTEMN